MLNCLKEILLHVSWHSEIVTFLSDLDGAGGLDPLAVPVPLPRHVLHRELADENGVLVLLDVHVLQGLQDQQLALCTHGRTFNLPPLSLRS